MIKDLFALAGQNLRALRTNPYPGRGLVIGMDKSGRNFIQAYWIMGRSENSRNRIFTKDKEGSLRTAPADPAKMKDPSLIIYRAMAEQNDIHVVSNGDQTETVLTMEREGSTFYEAMLSRQYEPDNPNWTSRITAVCYSHPSALTVGEISLLRRSEFSSECDRNFYSFGRLGPGLGHCVTTYSEDGDPLPAFHGEPYLLPFNSLGIEATAEELWEALNEENRVSLAVKFIGVMGGESRIHIINKYSAVVAS